MYHVYVLRSEKTGRHYTGSCEDLEDRLSRHNAGQSLATKHGVPWQLIYSEVYETRGEAIEREKFFKNGKGREELARLLS
jgi:putative endonuclease